MHHSSVLKAISSSNYETLLRARGASRTDFRRFESQHFGFPFWSSSTRTTPSGIPRALLPADVCMMASPSARPATVHLHALSLAHEPVPSCFMRIARPCRTCTLIKWRLTRSNRVTPHGSYRAWRSCSVSSCARTRRCRIREIRPSTHPAHALSHLRAQLQASFSE